MGKTVLDYLEASPELSRSERLLDAMLIAAGFSRFLVAAVFSMIEEYPGVTEAGGGARDLVRDQVLLPL